MHDLHDLLAGRYRTGHGLTGRFFLNCLDEIAGHGQRYVGLEQCDAHLAQGDGDILVGQRALLGQLVKDAGEAFG